LIQEFPYVIDNLVLEIFVFRFPLFLGALRKKTTEEMGFISGVIMGMIVGVALIAGWARAMARRAAKRSNKVGAATSFRFDVCDHEKFRSSSFGYLVLIFSAFGCC
jgi:Na+/proline symporter